MFREIFIFVVVFQVGISQLVYPPYAVPSLYYPAVATGWVWGSSNQKGPQEPIQGHVSSPLTNSGPIPSPLGEDQPMPPKMSPPIGAPPALSFSTPPTPARDPSEVLRAQSNMQGSPQFPPMPSPKPIDLKEFPKVGTVTSRPH